MTDATPQPPSTAAPTPSTPPPHDSPSAALLLSTFLWGFLSAVIEVAASVAAAYVLWFLRIDDTTLALIALPIPLALIIILGRSCISPTWRTRHILCAAALYSLGMWSITWAFLALQPPATGPLTDVFRPQWPSITFTVIALIVLLAWMVIYSCRRTSYLAALRLHPARCNNCRYDLSGLQSAATCPECGLHRQSHQWPAHWYTLSLRKRRILLALVLVLVAAGPVIYALRWRSDVRPWLRQTASLGVTEYLELWPGASGLHGRGAILRLKKPATRALLLVRTPASQSHLPAIRMWLIEDRPGTDWMWPDHPDQILCVPRLTPQVVCDFDAAQAAKLFEQGMPAALVDAMINAGAKSTHEQMFLSGDDLGPLPPTAIWIDPSRYLR